MRKEKFEKKKAIWCVLDSFGIQGSSSIFNLTKYIQDIFQQKQLLMGHTHTHLSLAHTLHFALCQRGTHILILGTAPRQWHLAGGFYMRHFQWLEWSQKSLSVRPKMPGPTHHPSPPPSFVIKGGYFCENEGEDLLKHIFTFLSRHLYFSFKGQNDLGGFAWIVLPVMIFTQGDEDLSFSLFYLPHGWGL